MYMCTCTLHFVLILIVRKVLLKLVISCDIKIDILGQKMNLNQQQKIMHKKTTKSFCLSCYYSDENKIFWSFQKQLFILRKYIQYWMLYIACMWVARIEFYFIFNSVSVFLGFLTAEKTDIFLEMNEFLLCNKDLKQGINVVFQLICKWSYSWART